MAMSVLINPPAPLVFAGLDISGGTGFVTDPQTTEVSVIAISGITLDNAAPVIESGAAAVAVILALYDAPHGEQATGALGALFPNPQAIGDKDVD